MDERQQMRASDQDREEVVGRLRAALDEGRLKMPEYVERMGLAYDAVTYADLAPLHADIPAATGLARPAQAAPAAPRPSPVVVPQGAQHMPTPLKVLWTIWLTVVSINVVVWFLVSVTSGHFAYPWPLWVAGPSGAALFGVTFGAAQIRRSRRAGPQGPPPGHGPSGSPR
ncbi:MAG TPA: DUF1707 domain-containing protein [Streptosporangiaceae bacterium]|nr:DUF1707 domain-containing protein [Streptosporangiaceae bacterium]